MPRTGPDLVVLRCEACGWEESAEGYDVRALLELLAELHNEARSCDHLIR